MEEKRGGLYPGVHDYRLKKRGKERKTGGVIRHSSTKEIYSLSRN